jgi:hypothetical protein
MEENIIALLLTAAYRAMGSAGKASTTSMGGLDDARIGKAPSCERRLRPSDVRLDKSYTPVTFGNNPTWSSTRRTPFTPSTKR